MGIFNKKVKEKPSSDFVKLIEGFSSVFMPFGNDKLDSDIFLSAVQTNATHRSKLKLVHRLKDKEQDKYKRLLQLRPNPIMNSVTFLESLSIDYDTYNNAFIFIDKDENGEIIAFWRINPALLSIGVNKSGNLVCRFDLQGYTYTVPFSRICHIGKNINKDEIFGDDNSAINKILGIINTNYQGIEAAIKTSGLLRYVVKVSEKMSTKQLKKLDRDFTDEVLNPLKAGGVRHLDTSMDLKELNAANQKYSNFAEQKLYATQVYNFLGTSEKIINGTNSDDEMIAYYERSVDTFALKLAQELTYRIFRDFELSHGNEIEAVPNRLAFMSMSRRIEIARIGREVGIMNKGAFADLLFLPIDESIREEPIPLSQNYKNGGSEEDDNKNKPDTKPKAQ